MKCKTCDTECNQFTAKTEKNMGKVFWSCPNKCKGWNGWVEEKDIVKDNSLPANTKPSIKAKKPTAYSFVNSSTKKTKSEDVEKCTISSKVWMGSANDQEK